VNILPAPPCPSRHKDGLAGPVHFAAAFSSQINAGSVVQFAPAIYTCGSFGGSVAKAMQKISYSGYRFPPEIIHQAVWLYLRFTLSFREGGRHVG
jgi:hypothetical protein